MKQPSSEPILVKLLTKWILSPQSESYTIDPPDHVISNGIWEVSGVEEKEHRRLYTLTCIWSFNNNTPVGKTVTMYEVMLIDLCHQVEINILPKHKSSSEPLEEKPTNEDVIKILGFTSTEEERTFFIKGYEYAKEKDKDELLLMVQDLEGYKSVVSSLESELKALREERDQFAIDFLEEVSTEYRLDEGPVLGNVFYLRGQPGKEYTSKELLEQFKAYTLNTEKN